jgi:2-polyprenyl-3-methyl-5-hydroxy-6-metoxy-1,4-benzoquinol methylase
VSYREIKSYYEDRYREEGAEGFPFSERRTRAALSPILSNVSAGATVLDIGCGVGYACDQLVRAGYRVAGTDISERALDLARERLPQAEFKLARESGELPWVDDSFGGIVCLGVLEHSPNPEAILAECARVLRPDGTAVFVVPNSRSAYFMLSSGTGQPYEKPRTLTQWDELFRSHGLRIRGVSRDPGPSLSRHSTLWRNVKVAAHICLNRLPIRLTYQFIFELTAD